ncbi:YlbL family protein [Corynebacterium aquilae]|uniref:Signal protein PDZ n=1 Tax=Corynebacterium aquilae DSM 44791 TaxID=1431546 RepID=A0A1L7CEE9_9CORY|nr:PDZ domain-containing protein [Corynebacterium aquilae]APT84219.1 signal protein PDZ [Corynebacterium aquilae DSM 44791]
MNRRLATLVWGLIPVVVATTLINNTHIPGTDYQLTVPLAAEGPGPVFNTLGDVSGEKVVAIDGAPTDATTGTMYMTTVAVRHNMPLSQALSRWIGTNDTIVPLDAVIPQNKTEEEVNEANKVAFASSENSATIAALNYLGKKLTIEVSDTVPDAPAADKLTPGDTITHVDGEKVTTPSQVQKLVRNKKPGDTIDIGYTHQGQPHNALFTLAANPHDDSVPQLGVLMKAVSDDGIDVKYNLQDIGGPSAGLVFTLTVIDKLTPEDLLDGHTIAGTGTIAGDGDVGPIGGIRHKIDAATAAGAEAFLVPAANCDEARRADTNIPLIKVNKLDDAVDSVKAFVAGKPVTTCQ